MTKVTNSSDSLPKLRPALTPEGRESQMIDLAERAAEKQLRDGTASSQIIVHYLKLATEEKRLEREILRSQNELIAAKTENLKAERKREELFDKAIKAMKRYSGHGDDEDDEY